MRSCFIGWLEKTLFWLEKVLVLCQIVCHIFEIEYYFYCNLVSNDFFSFFLNLVKKFAQVFKNEHLIDIV